MNYTMKYEGFIPTTFTAEKCKDSIKSIANKNTVSSASCLIKNFSKDIGYRAWIEITRNGVKLQVTENSKTAVDALQCALKSMDQLNKKYERMINIHH